jgi:hypothetical protein
MMARKIGIAELSLEQQAELLAGRYELLAAMMPRAMTIPTNQAAAAELVNLLRRDGARPGAEFLITMRQLCGETEEAVVRSQLPDDAKGGA